MVMPDTCVPKMHPVKRAEHIWLATSKGRRGTFQAAVHLSALEAGAVAAGSWVGRGHCSRGTPIRALVPPTPT